MGGKTLSRFPDLFLQGYLLIELILVVKAHILSCIKCYPESTWFVKSHGEESKAHEFFKIIIFIFFCCSVLFEQPHVGISRSVCRLKGCWHLYNATQELPLCPSLGPQALRGFNISRTHVKWLESEGLREGGNHWKSKPGCVVAHNHPINPYWKSLGVCSGNKHPTWMLQTTLGISSPKRALKHRRRPFIQIIRNLNVLSEDSLENSTHLHWQGES